MRETLVFVCLCCCAGRVSIVRELHVYGTAVAVHARDTGKLQHQGYGSLLMAAAERIALQVRAAAAAALCVCVLSGGDRPPRTPHK